MSNTATAPALSCFGQTATSDGVVFNSTRVAISQTPDANPGTTIAKYQRTAGIDTIWKNGQDYNVSTKQHCITAMKEYETKSLEELRMEDYLANRKGPQREVEIFGQQTRGGLLGSTAAAFGQTPNAGRGTSIAKYQGTPGIDTIRKNGIDYNVDAIWNCITMMKKYETKSLEELRMEDYLANRTGPQQGVGLFGQQQQTAGGLFGSTAAPQSTGLFGQQPENKSLFGTNTLEGTAGFGRTGFLSTSQASNSLFGKPFSAPATSNASFAFGTGDAKKPFGAWCPFGQATSAGLLNRPAITTVFDQTTTGFRTFGSANTQQPNLFGTATNQSAFGLNTSTGTTAVAGSGTKLSTAGGGGMFGNKPITIFDATTSNASSGFGMENQLLPFSNSITKAFPGVGMQTSSVQLSSGHNCEGGSLFSSNANKPGGLLGNFGQTGSLLGNISMLGHSKVVEHAQQGSGDTLFGSESFSLSGPELGMEAIRREILASLRQCGLMENNTLPELVSPKTNLIENRESESGGVKGAFGELTKTPNRSLSGATIASQQSTENLQSSLSYLDETSNDVPFMNPTGIVLRREGYYTIPSLDVLPCYMAQNGTCIVPNFTIGRQGYGNVYFMDSFDVAGLNLDEIVHIRHKEVIIYPDDENKPPLGSGLNRKAFVTVDQVWPRDKASHELIKDPDRLAAMDYAGKLRRICDKHGTRFIEYRPETGSWVFKVDHFSKYGMTDSDEEDAAPTDPKEQKMDVKPDLDLEPDLV